MVFLPLPADDELSSEAREAAAQQLERHGGRLSNADRALLADPAAFETSTHWHRLKDEIVPFMGERAVTLFAAAISDAAGSELYSAVFRRIVTESGDDPDSPQVTETEQLLLEWGGMLARDPAGIPDPVLERLEQTFNPRLRLLLLAFAGQLLALILLASAGRIPVDEELLSHRRPVDEPPR